MGDYDCNGCGTQHPVSAGRGDLFSEGWYFRYEDRAEGGTLWCPDCVTTKEPAPAHYQELADLLNRVGERFYTNTAYWDDSSPWVATWEGNTWVVKEDK